MILPYELFLFQDDQKQLYYISESDQDRTRVQINTRELSFPQVSYHDSTAEINFVKIQAGHGQYILPFS